MAVKDQKNTHYAMYANIWFANNVQYTQNKDNKTQYNKIQDSLATLCAL